MFACTSNNPVMRIDPNGYKWWHWTAAVGVVAVLAVAVVVTAGGAAPAIMAVAAAANGVCATTTALSVASFAFVGASTALAGTALVAGLDSMSSNGFDLEKFAGYGEEALIATTAGGAIGGLVGFSSCFVAGTLVKTEDGDKPIEDIKVGDLVYAENPDTGEKGLKKVVNLFRNEKTELVHIKVNDQEITTTNEHPFFVPEKGWTLAIDLRAGDKLVLVSGEIIIIEYVQHELLETPIVVYNFEVEDFHTYYVSELGVLVHNSCEYKPIRKGDMRATVNAGEKEAPHAHIFKKQVSIGRIFSDGSMDKSLLSNRDGMNFVNNNYLDIMGLIKKYYGR